ncbi:unnamed protein product [Polarella glacialis]|uniref:Uncharacterized protein n=1 Tax=Polarella glacialis TaxID=89957 RepID=A0A813DPN2_POLGL|nr:unnamed protein product [Polarella glacialis]
MHLRLRTASPRLPPNNNNHNNSISSNTTATIEKSTTNTTTTGAPPTVFLRTVSSSSNNNNNNTNNNNSNSHNNNNKSGAKATRGAFSQPVEVEVDDNDEDVWVHSHYYARGGQKKKALEALSKQGLGTSVHQVPEVGKMRSGASRVDVKIEYLREHFQVSDVFQRTVEDMFMCTDPLFGEPIVNVAKLRSQGRGRNRSPSPDSEVLQRPVSQASNYRSLATPDMAAEAFRNKVLQNADRQAKAVAAAREMLIEKRLDQFLHMQRRQVRSVNANRERPWFEGVIAAAAAVVMMKMLEVYTHGRHTIAGKVKKLSIAGIVRIVPDAPRPGGISGRIRKGKLLWREAKRRIHGEGVERLRILSRAQQDTIERLIAEGRLKDEKAMKRVQVWKVWRKFLRAFDFVIKVRRPLRIHNRMEALKEFLSKSLHASALTIAFKRYLNAVKLLQRAMKCSVYLMRVVPWLQLVLFLYYPRCFCCYFLLFCLFYFYFAPYMHLRFGKRSWWQRSGLRRRPSSAKQLDCLRRCCRQGSLATWRQGSGQTVILV